MSVKLGQNSIGAIYLGSTKIGQAYLGSTKVYDSTPPAPPTFVQTTPSMTTTGVTAWPVFNGDSPTRVDLMVKSSNSFVLKVDFITVNTSTSAETIYGYCDVGAGSSSSNVDYGILAGWVMLYLDVSAIARDLSSGDTTMKLDIYTSDYSSAQLTFDSEGCGYWK